MTNLEFKVIQSPKTQRKGKDFPHEVKTMKTIYLGAKPGFCGIVPKDWYFVDFDFKGTPTNTDGIRLYKERVFDNIIKKHYINNIYMETDKGYHLWFNSDKDKEYTGMLAAFGVCYDIKKEGSLFFIQKEGSDLIRKFEKINHSGGQIKKEFHEDHALGFKVKFKDEQLINMHENNNYQNNGWLNNWLHGYWNRLVGTYTDNLNKKVALTKNFLFDFWGLTYPPVEWKSALRKEETQTTVKEKFSSIFQDWWKTHKLYCDGYDTYFWEHNELIPIEIHPQKMTWYRDFNTTRIDSLFRSYVKHNNLEFKQKQKKNFFNEGYLYNNGKFYMIKDNKATIKDFEPDKDFIISDFNLDLDKKIDLKRAKQNYEMLKNCFDEVNLQNFHMMLIDFLSPFKTKKIWNFVGIQGFGKTTMLDWLSTITKIDKQTQHSMTTNFNGSIINASIVVSDDVLEGIKERAATKQIVGSTKLRTEKKTKDSVVITNYLSYVSLNNETQWLEKHMSSLTKHMFVTPKDNTKIRFIGGEEGFLEYCLHTLKRGLNNFKVVYDWMLDETLREIQMEKFCLKYLDLIKAIFKGDYHSQYHMKDKDKTACDNIIKFINNDTTGKAKEMFLKLKPMLLEKIKESMTKRTDTTSCFTISIEEQKSISTKEEQQAMSILEGTVGIFEKKDTKE